MAASKPEMIASQATGLLDESFQRAFPHFRESATQWCYNLNAKFMFYTGNRNLVVAAKPEML